MRFCNRAGTPSSLENRNTPLRSGEQPALKEICHRPAEDVFFLHTGIQTFWDSGVMSFVVSNWSV